MKKSEVYNMAQISVLLSPCITPENKLKILRVLIEDEDMEIFREKMEATEEAAVEE